MAPAPNGTTVGARSRLNYSFQSLRMFKNNRLPLAAAVKKYAGSKRTSEYVRVVRGLPSVVSIFLGAEARPLG